VEYHAVTKVTKVTKHAIVIHFDVFWAQGAMIYRISSEQTDRKYTRVWLLIIFVKMKRLRAKIRATSRTSSKPHGTEVDGWGWLAAKVQQLQLVWVERATAVQRYTVDSRNESAYCTVMRWLQLWFDLHLTAIWPRYDHSTTYDRNWHLHFPAVVEWSADIVECYIPAWKLGRRFVCSLLLNSCLTVMWSETVGLRTRPAWDQKNRSWSCSCSCRSSVVFWNTVLSRSSS